MIDESKTNYAKKKLLICCSGSVACVKLLEIVQKLKPNFEIKIVLTTNSIFFVKKLVKDSDLKAFALENNVSFHTDQDEWDEWEKNGKVLHIELRKWADAMLICPLSANTLAKISNGICDNLLTCIVRAWDLSRPVYFALAMNTYMYEHVLTGEQKAILTKKFGFIEIPTQVKKLACGDFGDGALASVDTIVKEIEKLSTEEKTNNTD